MTDFVLIQALIAIEADQLNDRLRIVRTMIENEVVKIMAGLTLFQLEHLVKLELFKTVMAHWEEQFEKKKHTFTGKLDLPLGTYYGETKEQLPQGQGYLQKNNGDVYLGEWKEGQFSGKGIYKHSNGKKVVALWENNKKSGLGFVVLGTQYKQYEGQFNDDLPHGQGCFYFNSEKSCYEGMIDKNRPAGIGRLKNEDGEVYSGLWKEGVKEGVGMVEKKNGEKILGLWEKGEMNLKYADIKYPDGTSYEGEFENYQRQGQGIFKAQDRVFICQWKKGKKEGRGLEAINGGDSFIGVFENDERYSGKQVTKRGTERQQIYLGNFRSGKKHGKGRLTENNGRIYVGQWVNGKRHGEGVEENGKQEYRGRWSNDKKHGKGVQTKDGIKYTGEWVNGLKEGEITITDSSGNEKKTLWKQGVVVKKPEKLHVNCCANEECCIF